MRVERADDAGEGRAAEMVGHGIETRGARLSGLAVAIFALLIAGCQFPRDPEGTLDRVREGTLRVGVIDDPPWVDLSGKRPTGVEPALVRQFAAELDAEIEWVEGTESGGGPERVSARPDRGRPRSRLAV